MRYLGCTVSDTTPLLLPMQLLRPAVPLALFFSSQPIDSQSSALLPSGFIRQANLPFSWASGPWRQGTVCQVDHGECEITLRQSNKREDLPTYM